MSFEMTIGNSYALVHLLFEIRIKMLSRCKISQGWDQDQGFWENWWDELEGSRWWHFSSSFSYSFPLHHLYLQNRYWSGPYRPPSSALSRLIFLVATCHAPWKDPSFQSISDHWSRFFPSPQGVSELLICWKESSWANQQQTISVS